MNTDTLQRIIDLERIHAATEAPPRVVEARIVRSLCGPWWLRWLWWLNVVLVRHQVRILVEARAQARMRLEARAQAEPKAGLTKAEREFVVRRVMEGASDEAILADLEATGAKADAVRRGLRYARQAINRPYRGPALADIKDEMTSGFAFGPDIVRAPFPAPPPEVDASDRA